MFTPANTSAAQAPKVFSLPLKLVVQAKYIGAIIGRGGSTIREISKISNARCMVDVHSYTQDDKGNQENMVIISGNPDSCSKACVKIMQIIHGEVEKERGAGVDVELKIRVIDQLIGRLIGKGGSSVKAIMEETGATISINDPHHSMDYGHYSLVPLDGTTVDRTIIIRGSSLEIVSNAERKISHKLRLFYEADVLSKRIYPVNNKKLIPVMPQPPPLVFLNSPVYSNEVGNYCLSGPPMTNSPAMMYCQSPFGDPPYPQKMAVLPNPIHLKSRIYVPSCFVGSLIGSKGSYIRSMMQFTGAMISIESSGKERNKPADVKSDKTKKPDDENKEMAEDANEKSGVEEEKKGNKKVGDDKEATSVKGTPERNAEKVEPVMISGLDHQVLKAEFWVYQRIAENSMKYFEEIVLTTEVFVPSKIVGRIIGRSGTNVRELQRITRAIVKVPDEVPASSSNTADDGSPSNNNGPSWSDQTAVLVTGAYFALQAVQCRFGLLIAEAEQREINDQKRLRNFGNKFGAGYGAPNQQQKDIPEQAAGPTTAAAPADSADGDTSTAEYGETPTGSSNQAGDSVTNAVCQAENAVSA